MNVNPTVIYAAVVVLAAVGLSFIWLIMRGNPSRRPNGPMEWGGVAISALVIVAAGGLAWVTYSVEHGADLGPDRNVVGREAPDLAYRLVESDEVERLSAHDGNVVLLNLWATWCAPCLEELPALNRLQQQFDSEGLVVLTISDEPRETLLRFAQERPHWTVNAYLPDESKWPFPYSRVEGARPTSFVIDRDGVIRATWPGARSYRELEQGVRPYL